MKKTRLLSLILAVFMLVSLLAACGGNTTAPSAAASEPAASSAAPADSSSAGTEPATSAALEPYTFTHYFNYDWWGLKPWGEDAVSKYLQEKFNVTVEFAKPDADAAAKLNVMISAGDLPDSIMMDRGVDNQKLAELGLLVDLEPLMDKNPALRDNLAAGTTEQLKVGGKLYAIPNWSRKATSGGNDLWMYNQRLYTAAGSPALNSFEDMHAYATKIKNDVKQTNEGVSAYPVLFKNGGDGWEVVRAFHRSMGGVLNSWYTVINGEYKLALREDKFKAATMEANKWWREGLMSETQFTDTGDQILEKLVASRAGLLWYDFSQNEANKFRTILRETYPDDSYEIVTPFPYPPAGGLPTSKIYADIQSSVGWNVTCITTAAKDPQRIYDLWSYLMTPEAAIVQMYGPKGGNWDNLDDQGRPILKKAESELTTDEINQLGAWFWMMPGQSDNVDKMKFAVNDMQPPEKQNWVASIQSKVTSPIMSLSDEFNGIGDVIDPKGDEGIARSLCEDYIKAEYVKAIMAPSAEEAEAIYADILRFCDENGMPAVEAKYNEKYKANVALSGTVLTK